MRTHPTLPRLLNSALVAEVQPHDFRVQGVEQILVRSCGDRVLATGQALLLHPGQRAKAEGRGHTEGRVKRRGVRG